MIDQALAIAARPEVIFCSFGDMLRVPGHATRPARGQGRAAATCASSTRRSTRSSSRARNPTGEVVFFAVGFETTAPANAMAVWQARAPGLRNFSLLVSHVLVPPAMAAILASPDNRVQGFLAAGHVCTVMGYDEYEPLAARYRVPIVVTGFEPLDLLEGVCMCVRQLEEGARRGREPVRARGPPRGQRGRRRRMRREVFEVVDRAWRGIGDDPDERPRRCATRTPRYDAERRFGVDGRRRRSESAECMQRARSCRA